MQYLSKALATLFLVTSITTTPAMAQAGHERRPPSERHQVQPPPPPGAHWDRDRGPPPYWNDRQWEYRQQYLRQRHHRDDDNEATIGFVAGAILGFVLGAAITDSQERQTYAQSRLSNEAWLDECARRYRSFDRDSGTYLGYDGLRHYCPVSQ
ncbi:MAG TPA: BA14K family protein [Vitreimonas sp.]|jgi:hypothetical protein|nr:BA14K family protein [Vitreimonas sp.]